MASEATELLQRVPLFSGSTRASSRRSRAPSTSAPSSPGETVAEENQGGVGFFIIRDGEAIVTVGGNEVRRLHAGDHFGEIALITEGPRTATVTAASSCKCYGLTPWEFRPLVQTNASIAWKILQALRRQVEQRH